MDEGAEGLRPIGGPQTRPPRCMVRRMAAMGPLPLECGMWRSGRVARQLPVATALMIRQDLAR
jgi:hypothetical protein